MVLYQRGRRLVQHDMARPPWSKLASLFLSSRPETSVYGFSKGAEQALSHLPIDIYKRETERGKFRK